MIVCSTCGKENQDHYKFCLGCGSDLPRAEAAAPAKEPTPPSGIPAMSTGKAAEAAAPEPEPEPAPAPAPEPEPEPEPVPEPAAAPQPAAAPEPAAVAPEPDTPAEEMQPAPRPTDPPATAEAEGDGSINCDSCGAPIQPGFAFCGACGTPVPGAGPGLSPQEAPQAVAEPTTGARLVLIQPDGTEGGHVEIPNSEVAVGRDAGGFFANDPFLSPTHAIFCANDADVSVKDADSLNGVFVKIPPDKPVEVKSGDIFRIGQELILFEEIDMGATAPDGTEKMGSPIENLWGRVALIVGKGRLGNGFPVGGDGVVMGRERGNILFPEDGYVSSLHLKLHREDKQYFITDLGSSNGSFARISDETRLSSGSFLLMGQQLFRIDL